MIDITRLELLRSARNASVVVGVAVVLALVTLIDDIYFPSAILLTLQAVYLLAKIINLTTDVRDARLTFEERDRR